jgi:hypothetical protein
MYNSSGAFIGLICIIVGIKLSLIPFHQWTPDVYETMWFVHNLSNVMKFYRNMDEIKYSLYLWIFDKHVK